MINSDSSFDDSVHDEVQPVINEACHESDAESTDIDEDLTPSPDFNLSCKSNVQWKPKEEIFPQIF